ncbi:hypothetical protein PTE30175_05571 [Pandoraea terrae]|uniref:Uncharacterized protein n=1 Tax=Pandoraea terrae TaxID=1537710 RepID=A0A5E4ZF58_9BURK|nr:resolvase [Pandoraea terrae]VVE59656.1 hypothetical protein PTE30175_05571 [Pandoraea terrae]
MGAAVTVDACGTTRCRVALPAVPLGRVREAAARLAAQRGHWPVALLSGVHNPWGYAQRFLDAWQVLDLCESDALVDAVAVRLGPDVVLWDSELRLAGRAPARRTLGEARCWPVEPLAGIVAVIDLSGAANEVDVALHDVTSMSVDAEAAHGAQLWVRYMPATSLFVRAPTHPAHRAMARHDPLINYAGRPLWLVRGENRAGNDFVTGFDVAAPNWSPSNVDDALVREDVANR